MNRKLIICFFFSLFCAEAAMSQQKGEVVVINDPLLDEVIAKRLQLSKSGAGNSLSTSGFRVQIFAGLGRENAYAQQTKFKSLYPDVPAYISYTQPNYRVRVGDFRSRLEAQRFMDELREHFSSVFIFEERIIAQ